MEENINMKHHQQKQQKYEKYPGADSDMSNPIKTYDNQSEPTKTYQGL